jgi:hypothetical protein
VLHGRGFYFYALACSVAGLLCGGLFARFNPGVADSLHRNAFFLATLFYFLGTFTWRIAPRVFLAGYAVAVSFPAILTIVIDPIYLWIAPLYLLVLLPIRWLLQPKRPDSEVG